VTFKLLEVTYAKYMQCDAFWPIGTQGEASATFERNTELPNAVHLLPTSYSSGAL
jgi:hypothetical protein